MATDARVAVVTGAGSGLGRRITLALARDGWQVVASGRRVTALEETAAEAAGGTGGRSGPDGRGGTGGRSGPDGRGGTGGRSGPDGRGGTVVPVAADVSLPDSVAALFGVVEERYPRLDLLVNNAGVFGPGGAVDEVSPEGWASIVGTNLTGSFLCAHHAVRLMKAQDPPGGRIINNGSISAHTPRPGSVGYTATKHAITGLTKSISLDGRPYNIACGQIDIGNAATDMTAGIATGAVQADGSVRPEPTFDAEHAAQAVLYMAGLPLSANVQFMTIMATTMPLIGRG